MSATLTAGERVRLWRQYRGLSLQQLAEKTGIEMTALSKLERKKRRLEAEHIPAICTALNISETEFFSLIPTVKNTANG